MRDRVRQMMGAGKSRDDILAAFSAQYGPQILTVPRTPIVWAVPYAVGLGAIVLVGFMARRWTRRLRAAGPAGLEAASPAPPAPTAAAPPAPAAPAAPAAGAKEVAAQPSTDYDDRLDDELRELD